VLFRSHLMKKKVLIPMIPQYLLFNEQGELVTNKSLKPSSREKLYNEIKEEINK